MRLALQHISKSDLQVLKWLYTRLPSQQYPLCMGDICLHAFRDNLDAVRWLHEHQCKISLSAARWIRQRATLLVPALYLPLRQSMDYNKVVKFLHTSIKTECCLPCAMSKGADCGGLKIVRQLHCY